MTVAVMAKAPKFSKVYRPDGWKGIMEMASNPLGLRLFAFLCLHCDHLNAVVAGIDLLAEELKVSPRSVRRAVRYLEANNHIVTCKIGSANCYVINAQEVFHNLDKFQGYVAINSKALAKKDNTLRRRLTHLIQHGQQELPFGEDEEDDKK